MLSNLWNEILYNLYMFGILNKPYHLKGTEWWEYHYGSGHSYIYGDNPEKIKKED